MSIRPTDSSCAPINIRAAVGEILPDIFPLILRSLCFEAILPLTTISSVFHKRIISVIRIQEQANIDATFNYLKTKLPNIHTIEEIPHNLSEATSLLAIRKCLVTSIKATVTFLKEFEPELLNPLLHCHEDVKAPPFATEIGALLHQEMKLYREFDPTFDLIDNSRSGIAVHSRAVEFSSRDNAEWLCEDLAKRDDFRNALKANKDSDPAFDSRICEIALEKGYTMMIPDMVNFMAARSLNHMIASDNLDPTNAALTYLTDLIAKVTINLPDDLMDCVLDGIITSLNKKNHFRVAANFVALLSTEEDKRYYLELIVKSAKEKEAFHGAIYAASFPLSEYPGWSFSFLAEIARRAADDANFSLVKRAIGAITLDEEDAVAAWKLDDLFLDIAKSAFDKNETSIAFKCLSMVSPNRKYSIELAVTEMEQIAKKRGWMLGDFLELVGYSSLPPIISARKLFLLKAFADSSDD